MLYESHSLIHGEDRKPRKKFRLFIVFIIYLSLNDPIGLPNLIPSFFKGRPFPLKGRFMANVFVHFEPIGRQDSGLPLYLKPGAPEAIIEEWKNAVAEYSDDYEREDDWEEGTTDAHIAVYRGDITALRKIISENVNDLDASDVNGWGLLHVVSSSSVSVMN